MNALIDSTWVLNSEAIKILVSAATLMTAKQKLHTPALSAIMTRTTIMHKATSNDTQNISANDTQRLTTWQSHIHIYIYTILQILM